METLRDTAFGKLVRLFSRYRWMQYPEEQDASVWPEYLKPETEMNEEPSTPVTENGSQEDLEAFGLYTVTSQVLTRNRRMSSVSTLQDERKASSQNAQSSVISWRGLDDPEVSWIRILCVEESVLTMHRIPRTGASRKSFLSVV